VHDLYPESQLVFDYSLPAGRYGELREKSDKPEDLEKMNYSGGAVSRVRTIDETDIVKIKKKMCELVEKDLPIKKIKAKSDEAISLFTKNGQYDKARLLKSIGKFFVSVYYLDGYGDTFYGPMLYSTGYMKEFDLVKYNKGFCLQFYSSIPPYDIMKVEFQEKIYDIFRENSNWCEILGAKDIGSVNEAISAGHAVQLIQVSEALHERKYAAIADKIYARRDFVKLVLISGPSSSGKTTTSKRLALQLKVIGLNPVIISLDNYFLNRTDTPLDEKGDYDFESIYALDLDLLNSQLIDLFGGKEIDLPVYNFIKGERESGGRRISLGPKDILVMEGIHALNPLLISRIPENKTYKIYASALTSLSIDENNSISTTDNRLLRRMVRDNNFRGTSAEQTILRWQSVRMGESKNIFPYQENADIMFNSSLIYEIPMLKHYAEPLLRRIAPTSRAYSESLRLLKFLSYMVEITESEQKNIPPTSIMREFIGGSSFTY
jgi:uridine kinase